MQRQFLKRTCDNPKCGKVFSFPMDRLTPDEEAEMSAWIYVTKEHVPVSGQPPQPLTRHGCCSSCAVEIIRNGMLEMPTNKIPAAN